MRRTAERFYRPGGAGRPGLDPAVLVKLALVLAWRGLPSMRATLQVAGTDVSIRRFLGFGLTERLPDHSTFSHAQTKRFADSSVFEQLSRRSWVSARRRLRRYKVDVKDALKPSDTQELIVGV